MIRDTRRTLLKGLAVTLPAAWTRPVVESVILPAHAQTSPSGCSAEAGCYNQTIQTPEGEINVSFSWPGGGGPSEGDLILGEDCEGLDLGPVTVVVAANVDEAADALSCASEDVDQPLGDLALTGGCSFFGCFGDD